ncbi:PREDICTED: uncharacterized protein LOC105449519 [Wasmannia auropunctata]|uniref:uncharacterized protein LOC105449519 n=1 Tax=Wasmannia auropunctata TaxID=64793 RepID=UPI0005F09EA0|nr:PREDICTED: uncharacterized protein LOC105449519 [Wasmannia auropunctata]
MARGNTSRGHYSRDNRTPTVRHVDSTLWSSGKNYDRPGTAIRGRPLPETHATDRNKTYPHHGVPSGSQRISKTFPQLKAAIKFHQTEDWTIVLPVVLMGIRAAWKEDLNATPAEIVFGESIRLPGQFLHERDDHKYTRTDDIVGRLQQRIQKTRPVVKRHGQRTTFIFKELEITLRVFVRHGLALGALQPPYDEPYEVLSRGPKTFKVQMNGKATHVSVDRIKPAYVLQKKEMETTQAAKTKTPKHEEEFRTRAERISKPPERFQLG